MTVERIHPQGLFQYAGLAQATVAAGHKTVHVAGQAALDAEFNVLGGDDYHAQAMHALANLKTALHAAGATFDDVLSTTIYIKNISSAAQEAIARALQTAFDGKPVPDHALTMLGVGALGSPALLVEISAVASI